jgi:hypothetical protein
MYLDNRTLFSDAQAIVATAASTNTIDTLALGKAKTYAESQIKRRLGIADIPLFLKVTEAFNLLTSLTIAVQQSDAEAFGSGVDTLISVSVPLASLIYGYEFPYDKLPRNITKRYVRMYYTVVGTDPTLGKISAGLTVGSEDAGYRGV